MVATKNLTDDELAARKAAQSKTGKSNVRKFKVHERRIANLLTEWSGVPFRRRRVEGRDATVIERESTSDIIPVRGNIQFTIEAKSGSGFSLEALMSNPHTCRFSEWWHQTCWDAHLLRTTFPTRVFYPMIFFKPLPAFDWVGIDVDAARQVLKPSPSAAITIQNPNDIWFPHILFDHYKQVGPITHNISRSKKNPIMQPLELPGVVFVRWRDFSAYVDPASLFEL